MGVLSGRSTGGWRQEEARDTETETSVFGASEPSRLRPYGLFAYAAILIDTGRDHGPTSPRMPHQRAK